MSSHYFRFTRRFAIHRQRAGLLELLIARADSTSPVTDWRADAFHVIAAPSAPLPGVAAAALYAECGAIDAGSVFLATPVHYVAEISNVRLPADGILSLREAEAKSLTLDFNEVWRDAGIRMVRGQGARLFCAFDQPLAAATQEPHEVLDQLIASHLPSGDGAPRLRQLMSEMEMWLFQHPVNRARIAADESPVNALWLWGGGPPLKSLPPVRGWTAGDDPLFTALGARADSASQFPAGVVVLDAEPGAAEWQGAAARRLARSVEDLHSGRISRLHLSAGSRCFNLGAWSLWRLWRRRRPWWEAFA